MSLVPPLSFIGTGKAARPQFQPRVTREPSRRGIQLSGQTRFSDFRAVNRQLTQGPIQEVGQRAAEIARIIPSGRRINLLV